MTNPGESGVTRHNATQRDYFEARVKPTMIPSDTPYVRRHVESVVDAARLVPGSRVLEVGCGMGRYTLLLDRLGINVEGFDLSQVLLDRLRAYAGDGAAIPLHCADVANPPEAFSGRYDAVVGFFMLHHVHDLNSCLNGIARVLVPGGRAVFLEPNPYNPLYYAQIALTPGMTWAGDRGIVHMRRRPLGEAMRAAGLEDFTVKRFGFFPPVIANRSWGRSLESVLERVPFWRTGLPFQVFHGRKP